MKRKTIRKRFVVISAIGLICIIVGAVVLASIDWHWSSWSGVQDEFYLGIVLLLIGVPCLVAFFVHWGSSKGIDAEISRLSSSQPIDMKQDDFAGRSKVDKPKTGGAGAIILGAFIGFIAMIFFDFIPVLGPILAGLIAGLIAGHGAGRGLLAGFLAGILGAVIVALLVTAGFGFFGSLLDMPIVGTLFGGAIGIVIIIMGLYNGLLGLIGGAIGGALRR